MREILQSIIRSIQENGEKEFWFREETLNALLDKANVRVEKENIIIDVDGCIITASTRAGKLFNFFGNKTEACFYRLESIKDLYDRDSKKRDSVKIL